ncbi:MAG: hypothetical protein ACFHWZ_11800 [Phycisphaerales bacterium]
MALVERARLEDRRDALVPEVPEDLRLVLEPTQQTVVDRAARMTFSATVRRGESCSAS